MKNEEILRLALEKTSTISEAKEAAEWMKQFLAESAPPEFTEKAKEILSKPIDDPAFGVDRGMLQFFPATRREGETIKLSNNPAPSNNGKLWRESDVREVIELHKQGVSNEDIGVLMGRKPNSIRDMLYKYQTGRQIGHTKYWVDKNV